jgi:hypothetical protein
MWSISRSLAAVEAWESGLPSKNLLDSSPILAGARLPRGAGLQIAEVGDARGEIDTRLGSGVVAPAVVPSTNAVGGIGGAVEERGLGIVSDPEKNPRGARVGLLREQAGERDGLLHGIS